MKSTTAVIGVFFGAVYSVDACPLIDKDLSCPEGCWDATISFQRRVRRQCEPVGRGNFSPRDEDLRWPCDRGTFSGIETAAACAPCPPGTHAPDEGSAAARLGKVEVAQKLAASSDTTNGKLSDAALLTELQGRLNAPAGEGRPQAAL